MTTKTTGAFAAHAKDAQWAKGLRPYFKYRDLGIEEATAGRVLAHVIRAERICGAPQSGLGGLLMTTLSGSPASVKQAPSS